jgi:hypothetical protein
MTQEKKTSRRNIIVPRGLSDHGLPKTPGVVSPNGSLRSYRWAASSPPLSPRSFVSLFRSDESIRSQSPYSPTATFKDSSPFGSPQFPPLQEFDIDTKSEDGLVKSCPNCGNCKEQSPAVTIDSEKENLSPDDSHSSITSLSRLAHRIKAALANKRKEEPAQQLKPVGKREVQKVEATHWTEM